MRNTGTRENERYAPDDPSWRHPRDPVLDRLQDAPPLGFEQTLASELDDEDPRTG